MRLMPAALLLTLLSASAARADGDGWRRVLSIDAHAGTRVAPLGAYALSAEWTPIRFIGLEVGGGTAYRGDYRLGAKLHTRLLVGPHALGIGAGLSTGPQTYDANEDRCDPLDGAYFWGGKACSSDRKFGSRRWSRSTFLNYELAYELRSAGGFHLRAALGYSDRIAASGSVCNDPPCGATTDTPGQLYFDLTLGAAFF